MILVGNQRGGAKNLALQRLSNASGLNGRDRQRRSMRVGNMKRPSDRKGSIAACAEFSTALWAALLEPANRISPKPTQPCNATERKKIK